MTNTYEIGPNGKADGGPATKPCGCGRVGRYSLTSAHTAMCHNPDCPVIAYHTSRPDLPPHVATRCATCGKIVTDARHELPDLTVTRDRSGTWYSAPYIAQRRFESMVDALQRKFGVSLPDAADHVAAAFVESVR
jgi:hypothetical protein